MARRATLLHRVRDGLPSDATLVQVAGPYEFLEPGDVQAPAGTAGPMAAALARLAPDVLCLAPEEAAMLSRSGLDLPQSAVVLSGAPQTRVVPRGGVRLGFVFFPMTGKPGAEPESKARAAVVTAAREMRGKADLVIGVSPWGSMAEEAFLTANPDAFDVLLGAGHGFGTPAMPQPVPRTLWARSHTKGKTIGRLDISLPVKKPDAPWLVGENHRAELLNPDYTVPGDPDIAILGDAPTVAAAPPPATTATP
ncbi:hypothetical protein G3N56_01225 [Desulfovibrio sulfodismutans]|uniref:Uncharacterized protein n=1 Tax=Desulfolutivibrio sulfodismutans TaxID=63561 RepID=A0A7K3NHV6_9BACT|nr:hypothetical protein [Desulfolutivibrio sulfodismutans]NDY55365.1 hypothetical protein [Desulfolutivibrio sulfodismutans]QLA12256.1 hypothetical protein GD606_08210 [Desulfolutivibrio sulfodismutans DSM 3696]